MQQTLDALGLNPLNSGAWTGIAVECSGPPLESRSPRDGSLIGTVRQATAGEYDHVMRSALAAFPSWREQPAPKRGDIVRQIGNALRRNKEPLGDLVSLETGKIRSEGQASLEIARGAPCQDTPAVGRYGGAEYGRHRVKMPRRNARPRWPARSCVYGKDRSGSSGRKIIFTYKINGLS